MQTTLLRLRVVSCTISKVCTRMKECVIYTVINLKTIYTIAFIYLYKYKANTLLVNLTNVIIGTETKLILILHIYFYTITLRKLSYYIQKYHLLSIIMKSKLQYLKAYYCLLKYYLIIIAVQFKLQYLNSIYPTFSSPILRYVDNLNLINLNLINKTNTMPTYDKYLCPLSIKTHKVSSSSAVYYSLHNSSLVHMALLFHCSISTACSLIYPNG